MNQAPVAVIGGGAAGMMAALWAKKSGVPVVLIEPNEKLGRKLYITGKGRCNLTNNTTPEGVLANVPRNGRFLYSAVNRFPPDQVMAYFEALGVPLKTERGGRVFPCSDRAADVIDALFYALKRAGIPHKQDRAIGLQVEDGRVTGVVLTHEEMQTIVDIVKEHDLFLVADEVYREFIYDDEPMGTFCEMEDIKDHVIVVDSISKRFSACGARVGCVVTRNKELQAALLKFCQSRLSVATIDQIGAAALYTVDPAFFRQSKEEYRRRRDTVISKLRQIPGVVVEEPMGAFYVMASLPVDDANKFQYWLLENFDHQGDTVMFAPGAPFYETPGKGINEVRIAYVLKQEDLERAMDVLAIGISEYQRKVMKITPAPVG